MRDHAVRAYPGSCGSVSLPFRSHPPTTRNIRILMLSLWVTRPSPLGSVWNQLCSEKALPCGLDLICQLPLARASELDWSWLV